MKKSLRSVLLISSITFFSISLISVSSCSNSQESKLVYTENDTIKQSVKEKEKDITWTQELEGEVLSERINRGSMELGQDVAYTKDLFKINQQLQKPVYPSYNDFGSLDTSNLRAAVKEKLNQFCTAFSAEKHEGADAYFSRKYIFNYVFFVNDVEEGWRKNFGKAYPETAPLFTKWTYGEPFNGSDIIQIPVRFYADCGTIDVTMFLNANGNNELYQITIDRWKKV